MVFDIFDIIFAILATLFMVAVVRDYRKLIRQGDAE